jgi:hypothetical protein
MDSAQSQNVDSIRAALALAVGSIESIKILIDSGDFKKEKIEHAIKIAEFALERIGEIGES